MEKLEEKMTLWKLSAYISNLRLVTQEFSLHKFPFITQSLNTILDQLAVVIAEKITYSCIKISVLLFYRRIFATPAF